jgi:hypothetical protein
MVLPYQVAISLCTFSNTIAAQRSVWTQLSSHASGEAPGVSSTSTSLITSFTGE